MHAQDGPLHIAIKNLSLLETICASDVVSGAICCCSESPFSSIDLRHVHTNPDWVLIRIES